MPAVGVGHGKEAEVSIRARFLGRAMHLGDGTGSQRAFVSIRARFLGRAMRRAARAENSHRRVSIRARFLGRAMPFSRLSRFGMTFGFNPRPVFRPGDALGFAGMSLEQWVFQSAPGF